MADFKFRVWIPETKEFIKVNHPADFFHLDDNLSFEDMGIEQSTGVKDSKGVTIFEGDILSFDQNLYPDDTPSNYKVVYVDGAFRKKYNRWDKDLPMPYLNKQEISVLSDHIVGNIHENKTE